MTYRLMANFHKILIFGFLFGVFFVPVNIYAQSLDQLLGQIREKYNTNTNFKVNIAYKLYEHPSTKVKEVKKGTYYRKGNYYYVELGEAEMLYTPALNMKINHIEKAILVSNSNIGALPVNFSLDAFPNTEKSLTSNAKYKIITIKAGKISQFPYSKVVFYFDKKQLLLHKVSFYLLSRITRNEKTNQPKIINYRLDLSFTNYQFDPHYSTDRFSVSKYLSFKDKKPKGRGRLSGYEIIDIRKKNK